MFFVFCFLSCSAHVLPLRVRHLLIVLFNFCLFSWEFLAKKSKQRKLFTLPALWSACKWRSATLLQSFKHTTHFGPSKWIHCWYSKWLLLSLCGKPFFTYLWLVVSAPRTVHINGPTLHPPPPTFASVLKLCPWCWVIQPWLWQRACFLCLFLLFRSIVASLCLRHDWSISRAPLYLSVMRMSYCLWVCVYDWLRAASTGCSYKPLSA